MNFRSDKNLILLIFVIIITVILFLIYVWRGAFKDARVTQDGQFPNISEILGGQKNYLSLQNSYRGKFLSKDGATNDGFEDQNPIYGSFLGVSNDEVSTNTEAGDIIGATTDTLSDVFHGFIAGQNIPGASSDALFTHENSQNTTITKEELFQFAYSEDYRKTLQKMSQTLIDTGLMDASAFSAINSMDDAVKFQDALVNAIQVLKINSDNGGPSADDLEKYQKSYREVLPKLWESELRARKAGKQGISYLFNQVMSDFERRILEKKRTRLLAWVDKNITAWVISEANAQITTLPECYRQGVSNGVVGSQRAAGCCNCGFDLRPHKGYFFVPDCGEDGCVINIGCLNGTCPFMPAIWDPATGICGCWI